MFFRRRIIVRRRIIHPDKSRITFKEGQTVSLIGKQFLITVEESRDTKYSTARCRDGVVKIRLSANLDGRSRDRHISILARRAITKAVLPMVRERVGMFNDQHFQSELGRITLKDNISNWGSCSIRNNINLDFRLLFGPQEILDAVILHELTHTRHRDHSRNYYATLLPIMPDNRKRLRWLRDNGQRFTSEESGTIIYPEAKTEIKEEIETPSFEGQQMLS